MSLVSTLALLASAAAARIRPRPVDVLESTIDDLKRELADARRELELERQFTAELARRQAQHHQLAAHDVYQQGLLGAQMAQQHQAAMQQNLQNAAACGQGMIFAAPGAQMLSVLDPEMWCNCVPSRAQVWAAHGDDAA